MKALLHKTHFIWLMLLTFLFVGISSDVHSAQISKLRIGQGISNVRIVFDADSKFEYKAFLLSEPKRLVVDAKNVSVSSGVEQAGSSGNLVSATRVGSVGVDGVRIVFDLQQPVIIKKAFMLPPQSNFNWRFVVDVEIASEREFIKHIGNDNAFTSESYAQSPKKISSSGQKSKHFKPERKKVIVLDPGHGGVDPGAIGVSGIYEKKITLSMAKELKEELDKTGKYTVYLTRNRDVFIPLRERVRIARRYDADLFLSIHADSAVNRRATGLSVYTLSETASDKEAAALAEKENKADIVAGLDFAEHSKEVSDVLLNLAQRETLNRSAELATFMVQEMRKSTHTLDNTHRFAGFAVLKAPDVPSILLELGYLSNRTEEKQLQQKSHRKKLAVSARKAIDKYFKNMQSASVF